MKKIAYFFKNISLVMRIFSSILLGICFGLWIPGIGFVSVLGDLFTGVLKAIAPVLVFVLVISSLSRAGKGHGKRFRSVIVFYLATTFLAAVAAVLFSFAFHVTIPLENYTQDSASVGLSEVFETLITGMVMNPFKAIIENNYIGILIWSVVLGLALRTVASERTKAVLNDISDAVSKAVSYVIALAPFGIFGIVFGSVSEYGIEIFKDYGRLLLVLTGCMFVVSLVINPLVVCIALKCNPYPLLIRCLKESGITAFFTRSSVANIPINMKLCEKLGLDTEYYSVAIPLGATINMNGAAVTITIMSLSAAFSQGVEIDIFSAILLSFTATLCACGASGIAGGSLLLIPMACSLLNVSQEVAMQVVSVGFITGIIHDSLETVLNSSGDVLFCATAEFMEWQKNGRQLPF